MMTKILFLFRKWLIGISVGDGADYWFLEEASVFFRGEYEL